jgi:hypothetical protein
LQATETMVAKPPGGDRRQASEKRGMKGRVTADHPNGTEQDEINVAAIDLSAPDVIIVEAPDGKRSVVKGQNLVADARSETGHGTARVMSIRCERWSEVALLLSRLGV